MIKRKKKNAGKKCPCKSKSNKNKANQYEIQLKNDSKRKMIWIIREVKCYVERLKLP